MSDFRVALVLGGGAVQGAVWLEGALAALAEETGWSPADAGVIVGTSAGSWLATMLAAGVPPWLLAAQSSGDTIDGLIPGPRPPRAAGTRWVDRLRALHPVGSPHLLASTLARPWAVNPKELLTAWLPRGTRDGGGRELVSTVIDRGWPDHPGLWIVACDYRTGRRVVFGRDPETPADVWQAVAASCAVPAYFKPVRIGGREYVDGGVHSVSNLDVVAAEHFNLVICLNPSSTLDLVTARTPADLVWSGVRYSTGRRLGREARAVRRTGTPLLLLQPTRQDIEVLGNNWMRASRHPEIIARARQTVGRQLRESPLAPLLEQLPQAPAHMIRRPPGPPSAWPPIPAPPKYASLSG